RAHLRATRDRAARKYRPQHLARPGIRTQPAAHVRHDVMDVRVALHRHQLADRDAAWLTDAAEIVALEVDQHDVLGALLHARDELLLQPAIGRRVGAARARAGDGARLHLASAHFDEPLGG